MLSSPCPLQDIFFTKSYAGSDLSYARLYMMYMSPNFFPPLFCAYVAYTNQKIAGYIVTEALTIPYYTLIKQHGKCNLSSRYRRPT